MSSVALFCFALLAYAWYLQHGPQLQQPCPLCVLQRMAYILVCISAVVAAYRNDIPTKVATMLLALGGGALATWQVLKGGAMTACQRDPIGIFVNGLPTADHFPQYFFASGGCADQYSVLGLPVPVWSLICFFIIMDVCVLAIVQDVRKRKLANQ
jgi:protein dithiol:quinone oxidoreductase